MTNLFLFRTGILPLSTWDLSRSELRGSDGLAIKKSKTGGVKENHRENPPQNKSKIVMQFLKKSPKAGKPALK